MPIFSFRYKYLYWCCVVYSISLIVFSLYPRSIVVDSVQKEKSSGQFPKEGDNFKVVDAPVVYRLENGHRRPYKSATAFLERPENPPFGTAYEQGGILLCDSVVLLRYSIGVKMPCLSIDVQHLPFNKRPYLPVALGETLIKKDKIEHLLSYIGLAMLLYVCGVFALSYSSRRTFWGVLILGSILGFLLEVGQQFLGWGREAEWQDMLMNILGLLVGLVLAQRLVKKLV